MALDTVPHVAPLSVPLVPDAHGRLQVRGHRIWLEGIVWCLRRGDTFEGVQEAYPTIPMTDLLAILAYVHANRVAVDAYVDRRRREDEEATRFWQTKFDALHRERGSAGGTADA